MLELARAGGNAVGEHAVDADRRERERDEREHAKEQRPEARLGDDSLMRDVIVMIDSIGCSGSISRTATRIASATRAVCAASVRTTKLR